MTNTSFVDVGGTSVVSVLLDSDLENSYMPSPIDPQITDPHPFSEGKSAAVGVISGCDSSTNQLNTGSCFFDSDMRDIEEAFADGYVEFIAPGDIMNAVPFTSNDLIQVGNPFLNGYFHMAWFENKQQGNGILNNPNNFFHNLGSPTNLDTSSGYSDVDSDYSYIAVGWIENRYGPFPEYVQQAVVHETGHQFRVNPCDSQNHDSNEAWCSSSGGCADPLFGLEMCVMYENKEDPNWYFYIQNGINRFDCINLAGPAAGILCGDDPCPSEIGIRALEDPE